MLETCREMKLINKYMNKCIRLVINENSYERTSTKDKRRTEIMLAAILKSTIGLTVGLMMGLCGTGFPVGCETGRNT
jgi:hypothetical protein